MRVQDLGAEARLGIVAQEQDLRLWPRLTRLPSKTEEHVLHQQHISAGPLARPHREGFELSLDYQSLGHQFLWQVCLLQAGFHLS